MFAVFALHSHSASVTTFNGLNFSGWCEHIKFHLGVLDHDVSLFTKKSTAITETRSTEERSHYKCWDQSNILGIMFMQMNIVSNIKSTLPKTENAKDFQKFVEESSQTANKSIAGTLMGTLTP